MRRVLFSAILFLFGATLAPPATAAPEPPNIVLFVVDDLGWRDLGCYGNTFYQTPSIDHLASEGMRFTDAYAGAPVCSPTRASLLTGKYTARVGVTDWIPGASRPHGRLRTPPTAQQLPLQETTIAEMLKPHGYTCAHVGKWHLGMKPYYPEHQGFDLNVSGCDRGAPGSYFYPFGLPTVRSLSEGKHLTEYLAEEAESFLDRNRQRRFFLYMPYYSVHIPLQARRDLTAKYAAKNKEESLQENPVYAAMVEAVDQSVGRILNKLNRLRLKDKTVVILTSDNGGLANYTATNGKTVNVTSNAPLRGGKGSVYEGGIRVPLMVCWPGVVDAGTVCHQPVISADLYPTIRQIAGIETPPDSRIDGESLVSTLKGEDGLKRDTIYWHYPHYNRQGGVPAGAVRRGDYKLIEFYEDGHLELYNLRDDIGEQNNLASQQPDKAQQLHKALADWRASVNAQMPTPNPDYDPSRSLKTAGPPSPPGMEP